MSKNWTDEELEASVRCYLEMKDKELKGKRISWSKDATEKKYFGAKGKPNKLIKITKWN